MSFGSSTKKTNSSFNNQTDPWDETVPYLKDFLSNLGDTAATQQPGATADQVEAFKTLKANAADGNPNAGAIMGLAKDQLNTADNSGMVKDGFADLQKRLTSTANGDNLDLENNGYLQKMLTQVGDDAANRVNAQFAAAGRDFSGANQQSVARGVTQAQAPLLLDFFNKEQGRTDQAARDLYGAAGQTAGTLSSLDQIRDALRSKGIDTTSAALAARDQGANTTLNLDQQLKGLPYQDLAQIAQLLFPAAQLGQQSSGNGTSTTKSSGFSFGIGDIGKAIAGLGTLCDATAKTDVQLIGKMADGVPLYRWRYHGDPQVHIGPMAQDIGMLYPHAVTMGGDGFLRIDLDLATRNAAKLAGG